MENKILCPARSTESVSHWRNKMKDVSSADEVQFCQKSAAYWEKLAEQADMLALRASSYNTEVAAHMTEVASSYWKNAAQRRIEAIGRIEGLVVDLSLSPR